MINKSIVLVSLLMASTTLIAKEKSTIIGEYLFPGIMLMGSKTFENKTSKPLVLTWQITCPLSDVEFRQDSVISIGSSYKMDLAYALEYMQFKLGTKHRNYILKVSLGVVVKAPVRPRTEFEFRALRWSEKGLCITKPEFIEHNHFELFSAKNGKISCELSKA